MAQAFDFVIRGAGLSGLTLAVALIEAFPERSILLVDPGRAKLDRTFGFWCVGPPPFAELIERSDAQLLVHGPAGPQLLELGERRYHALRWSRLREHLLGRLRGHAGVRVETGRIDALRETSEGVEAMLDGQPHLGKFAFDSRLDLAAIHRAPGRVLAWQRFWGQRIELHTEAFERACFMDLRASTAEQFAFAHVVPEPANTALIYRVEIAADPDLAGLERRLEHDLHTLMGLTDAHVLGHECGALPLSDQVWQRRVGDHTLRIGNAGGRLEPATGYAFTRIVADNQAIVASLREHDHPFALPRDRARFRWLDGVLLKVLCNRPNLGPTLFERLFRDCRTATVFDLLDERASLVELLEIMWAMPYKPTMAWAGLQRALAWLRAPGRPALPPSQ